MPNPYSGHGSLDFSDAPGGDLSLDDLFPPEGEPTQPTTAQSEQTPTSPEAQFLETPGDEFFLKTPTGTVYKTQEEAIKGLSHKDETIERLRSLAKEKLGYDPLTDKQAPTAPEEPNYANDPLRFWNDTSDAVKRQDPVAWHRIQQKFMQDSFAPYAPVLQSAATAQAIEQASSQIPNFREFRTSNDYLTVLDSMPVLKNAIALGENNPQAASQLPELYRLAYLSAQGLRANEIVKQGVTTTPATAQPTRPTTPPTTLSPPPPAPPPDLRTTEGRKAIVEQATRRGVADVNWKDLGF